MFTERIGGTDGYPLISHTEAAGECGIPFFELTYSLGSYEDNNFYYHVEDCPGVGIHKPEAEVPVSVSPNPATDVLHVEMETAPESPANLTIYNMSGKPVKQVSIQRKHTTIDLSELTAGIYLLRFTSLNSNSPLFSKRIIKE
ncbi:MAG: T9SS type A sorting domain-containing protein [Bacteroidales bacterium]|nr:T9SS type A sorting domain-containing protein [Bacteroidales bacterium]